MKRSIELDCIRGLAVILVLFHHLFTSGPAEEASLSPFIVTIRLGGWVGVDLFFVLSGFLVAGLLFREYLNDGRVSVWRFLARRGFKIYPPFYFMLVVTILAMPIPVEQIIPEIFFIQNYFHGFMGHTWSLAVEEHFYLLFALLVGLLVHSKKRNPFSSIPWITLGLMIFCLVARLLLLGQPFTLYAQYFPTHLRLDELAIGASLAYAYHFHPEAFISFSEKYKAPLIVSGILLLLPPFFMPRETMPFIWTFGITLAAIGTGALVVASHAIHLPTWLPLRVLAYIGVQSYSIYLWHLSPVIMGLKTFLPLWTHIPIAIIIGIIFGIVIERPFLGMRNILLPTSHQRRKQALKLTA